MANRQTQQLKELTRKNKPGSLDAIEAKEIIAITEMLDSYEFDYSGNQKSRHTTHISINDFNGNVPGKVCDGSKLQANSLKREYEDFYNFEKNFKGFLVSKHNGFIEVSKTFNFDYESYLKWKEEKEKITKE